MDKKKKISFLKLFVALSFVALSWPAYAQNSGGIRICDKQIDYTLDNDSITLFLKLDNDNKDFVDQGSESGIKRHLLMVEDGDTIRNGLSKIRLLTSGKRVPSDYTISVLVDLNIPEEGKKQVCQVIRSLVESARDSCVYLSFFGEKVSKSEMVTSQNFDMYAPRFGQAAQKKNFYGALYSKLTEFSWGDAELMPHVIKEEGYEQNKAIAIRANSHPNENLLFLIADGSKPAYEKKINFLKVTDYQRTATIVPKVYAFYYTGNGNDRDMAITLDNVAVPRIDGDTIHNRVGKFLPADDMGIVLSDLRQAVESSMADFSYTYKVLERNNYTGNKVRFEALWDGISRGEAMYSIGSEENPWPKRSQSAADWTTKLLLALLITAFTIVFYLFILKIFIPWVKSMVFVSKYYKRYEPEENVTHRVCHFCKQEIVPGQKIVARCKHIMHVECWKQNEYHCAEYGQNCKDGIQDHVDWSNLFKSSALRDSYQTIAGIVAGLVSWIVYELLGRGHVFDGMARSIVKGCLSEAQSSIFNECVAKVASFLAIGLLLAFFMSLVFRFTDGVRKTDGKSLLKVFGLSLLSGVIGMAAFALGGVVFCWIQSGVNTPVIKWYSSLPAYLLFSVFTSLSLVIKSSIPVKSALLGGIASAVIGFLVLYLSSRGKADSGWDYNMLLNFIIYGGGLGASLVTVRMLAEKYYLVIKNGVKAGQRIPIHKWMSASGGGNKVTIGMTERCEIQMSWEKSNKVAKEHAQLFVDHTKSQAMIKPLATKTMYNSRAELAVNKPVPLSNGDTFTIGDTIFQYVEC